MTCGRPIPSGMALLSCEMHLERVNSSTARKLEKSRVLRFSRPGHDWLWRHDFQFRLDGSLVGCLVSLLHQPGTPAEMNLL